MTIDQFEKMLIDIAKKGVKEYHLTPGAKPFIREHGLISEVSEAEVVSLEYMNRLVASILSKEDQVQLYADGAFETAYSIENIGRFRIRFGRQRSSLTLVIFIKSTSIPSVKDLKIPESVIGKMNGSSGLLIVTGETKSNKTTTIASLLSEGSKIRPRIVTTVENPIDYLLSHGKGIVNQMEVGVDIKSTAKGIKEAINNHSDIIYISDVQTKEEWQLVFDALEKGFFVIVSMNSRGIEAAIDHMLFLFNKDEQPFVKRLLAHHLNAFLYEVNVEMLDGKTAAVYEVLLNNKAVRNMFLENKLKQLPEIFKSFPKTEMRSMDMALADYVKSGLIDRDLAISRSHDKSDFMKLLNGVK
ncbi:ATPase, T2SS/T4P/T4SS family [Acidaminobacter sp. JC074]|uniref:ATPase, T2SS/T4P/T4SS family n=1 Tax=Acidaminobacter sp. JC074 TaxID=2530199 RepID=UPI001F106F9D|nr:ATPase, T2SS/T4P/T4SS family [Acidaminobacter sp. JC074]